MKKGIFTLIALLILATSFHYSSASVNSVSSSLPGSVLPNDPDPVKVKTAIEEFKSLSKKEKRQRIKNAKKEMKAFKAERKSGKEPTTNTLLLVIVAILLPPLAVYLHEGEINNRFWIDLLLTLLFYVPGLIYALVIILRNE